MTTGNKRWTMLRRGSAWPISILKNTHRPWRAFVFLVELRRVAMTAVLRIFGQVGVG